MMVLVVAVVVAGSSSPARAGDGTEGGNSFKDQWGAYPVDFVDLSDLLDQEGLGESLDDLVPDGEPCPEAYEAGEEPDTADIVYKTFHRQASGSPAIPLFIDQWDPQNLAPETPAPAIVLFHGGGWHHSCRRLFGAQAATIAATGYIVFSADYRLACKPTDVPPPTADEAPLCGWQYQTVDPDTSAPRAAMRDVQDAVTWVANHAGDYWSFNGKVAGTGGSSGGNLLYRGASDYPTGDIPPDVVGGWSGPTFFANMHDLGEEELLACNGADTPADVASCWQAVVRYLACDIGQHTEGDACWQLYEDAEPYRAYTSDGPPAFVANSTAELVNILNQSKFVELLGLIGVPNQPCTVQGDAHGRAYVLNGTCDEFPTQTVLEAQLDFFSSYVYP